MMLLCVQMINWCHSVGVTPSWIPSEWRTCAARTSMSYSHTYNDGYDDVDCNHCYHDDFEYQSDGLEKYYLAFRMAFAQGVALVLECGWIKGLAGSFCSCSHWFYQ